MGSNKLRSVYYIQMAKKKDSIQLTLLITPELRDDFKIACTKNKKSMTQVLIDFMTQYADESKVEK